MRTNYNAFLKILLVSIFIYSCGESGDMDPKDDDQTSAVNLDFPFTLASVEKGYTMEIDGVKITDVAEIVNSLENDKSLVVNFLRSNDFNFGGISWIPLKAGEYTTGHNLGKGNGTFGNDLFMVAFVKKDGTKYHAYSSHEYGYLEDRKIPGSVCKVKIRKLEGKHTTYSVSGFSVTQFIGVIEGQFAGTFKTPEGKELKVTNGQFRIENKIPSGARVMD